MSNENHIPGQTFHLRPLVINPDREQTFSFGSIGGGGYSGHGDGWGAQEGPHRGEGSPGRPREIAIPNVMADFMAEQIQGQLAIDNEYNARFENLPADTDREWEEKKQTIKGGKHFSSAQSAESDQTATLQLIEQKQQQSASIIPAMYGLDGHAPFYLMNVLPVQRIRQLWNSGQMNQDNLLAAYALFDSAYKAALEYKRLYLSVDRLAEKLPELARQKQTAEQATPLDEAAWAVAQQQRIRMIELERDIHAQKLPEFLQTELVSAAGSVAHLTLTQALTHYKAVLESMAANRLANIQPIEVYERSKRTGVLPSSTNPKVNAPLSKPELEALNELVHLQHTTDLGKRWITHHDAVLKEESARHLNYAARALNGLIDRSHQAEQMAEARRIAQEQARIAAEAEAKRIAQEKARIAAETEAKRVAQEKARIAAEAEAKRVAQEKARIAAEAEAKRVAQEKARIAAEAEAKRIAIEQAHVAAEIIRTANTFRVLGSVAATQSVVMTSWGPIAVTEGATISLQAAVRAAVIALADLLAGTVTAFFVGVAALVYTPKLANGELPQRFSFSTPLSDLAPELNQDLPAIAAIAGTVDVPFRISSQTAADGQTKIIVVKTDGEAVPSRVKVVTATHDPKSNTYSFTTPDQPPRTLTWTPAVPPIDSSTSLPVEQPPPTVYPGAEVAPTEGRIDTFPELAETGFDDYILTFPQDAGLPPLYVMFRDRRGDPGVATGYGQPITGNWLEQAVHGKGAPIPAQIADQLRGKEFKNFREFRETLWKAVANDPGLSAQFSPSNLARMRRGSSPFAPPLESVGRRKRFEIHHIIYLKNDGELYDVDNLQMLTPKKHIATHQ
ncbi:hypothetical protein PS3A_04460 [Pseudomonas sp. 3A(2025)]